MNNLLQSLFEEVLPRAENRGHFLEAEVKCLQENFENGSYFSMARIKDLSAELSQLDNLAARLDRRLWA
jgi:hypothetical protein